MAKQSAWQSKVWNRYFISVFVYALLCQFTMTVTNLSGTILYRGYAIYQDENGMHNVYTDVYTETF